MTIAADIIPRDLRFGIDQHADRAWFGDDMMLSALLDSFAVLLPEGERYFIKALRSALPAVTDPEVRAGIQGYAVQEAFHTREHESYNDAMRALGHNVDEMEARVAAALAATKGLPSRVVVTCAIEHLTYTFSHFFLSRPEQLARMKPAYRRLWAWHALEELEHSGVALQVVRDVTGHYSPVKRYLFRVMALNIVIVRLGRLVLTNLIAIMARNGRPMRMRDWLRLLWLEIGPFGIGRVGLLYYAAYMIPGFRGLPARDARMIEAGRRLLEQYTDESAVPAAPLAA
ncbi:metal-dependent hydrolase [Rhodovarius crocodyli]|uniref:metal-dependent hydrolase n=1 Tax=Rhodovarius crocodyli TaxID=1979269 RepID=UPI0013E31CEE|nr:metal-dependent hydrolase [Rhodovarius crocodyli]